MLFDGKLVWSCPRLRLYTDHVVHLQRSYEAMKYTNACVIPGGP